MDESIDPISVQSTFLYTGQQFDIYTELYNLRARQYDPSNGRFTSRDTWAYNYGNPFELNRYVYGANNPTTYTDPSGNQVLLEYKAALALAAVAVIVVLSSSPNGDLDVWNAAQAWFGHQFQRLINALRSSTEELLNSSESSGGSTTNTIASDVEGGIYIETFPDGLDAGGIDIEYFPDGSEFNIPALEGFPDGSEFDIPALEGFPNGTDLDLPNVFASRLTQSEIDVARANYTIPQNRWNHAWDSHAHEYFGVIDPAPRSEANVAEWNEIIEQGTNSNTVVEWSLRGQPTFGHLTRYKGKYLFVQYFDGSDRDGQLATVTVPGQRQLSSIFRILSED